MIDTRSNEITNLLIDFVTNNLKYNNKSVESFYRLFSQVDHDSTLLINIIF